MAKKRKKKKQGTKKRKQQIKFELLGLLFIFLAIFGSGAGAISDGAIPSGLENLFRFFLGFWYFTASLALLIVGIMLFIKRRFPDFTDKKLIGFYIGFLGLLLLTHIQTYEPILLMTTEPSILRLTWDHFLAYVNNEGPASQLGGGFVGGLLFTFTYYLFSSIGAKIVAVFSIVIGFIFMTEISLGEFLTTIWKKVISTYEKGKEKVGQYQSDKKANKDEVEINPQENIVKEVEDEPVIQEFTDISYALDQAKQDENPETEQPVEEAYDDTTTDMVIPSAEVAEVENYEYELPSSNLLTEPAQNSQQHEKSKIQATVRTLETTFHSFGVKAKVTKVHVGPAVTKYEVYPEAGVKVSRIVSLHDDLALALAAQDIRIEAPIPGKSAVGIEVPNGEIATVSLREVLDVTKQNNKKLLFALGKDISGNIVQGELNKMPHLLIAGATGSGKSVCINGIITSILMRATPDEVKMMMIDPKKVELNVYNGIPHLLTPVVTDRKKASVALKKIVAEMESRYELFSETGKRNLEGYNNYIERQNELTDEHHPTLPYIIVLVDELADLVMVASNDVEDSITRLAQMARAAGIHLIIATQRPSVDVITGVIKANIPSRIAFSVSSQVDSRTILDIGGAEKLLGRGDMLYIPVGMSKPIRVQGAFLSDEEVGRIVDHCKNQQKVTYQEDMIPDDTPSEEAEVEDELYHEAVQLVVEMQSASVSMLQR